SGDNDCSQWADCINEWASYTCACLDGFIDNDPERPGRVCRGRVSNIQFSTTRTPTTHTSPTTSLTTRTPTTVTARAAISTTAASTTPAVRNLRGELSVQCWVDAITVSIARDFLLSANIQDSALYLGSPGCRVSSNNSTHVQLTVAWDECDAQLNETSYTVSVTLFNSMDSYVSAGGEVKVPRLRLEVPIMCTYMRSKLISADYGSTGYDTIQEIITGLGSFQVRVQLMNGTAPLPQNYSLSPEEAVVVEVSLNTSSQQIKLVINRCWATATRNPVDVNSYAFLENSCSQNTFTKVLINGNSSTSRVSVQIFSIVSLDVIYLHCQVQICLQIGADSCVPVLTVPLCLVRSEAAWFFLFFFKT
uniref:ZP domain-containing protein n=1 Tax=Salarias fasciatus TaxID=181472 RepID=A0A672GW98_SALFA